MESQTNESTIYSVFLSQSDVLMCERAQPTINRRKKGIGHRSPEIMALLPSTHRSRPTIGVAFSFALTQFVIHFAPLLISATDPSTNQSSLYWQKCRWIAERLHCIRFVMQERLTLFPWCTRCKGDCMYVSVAAWELERGTFAV